MIENVTAYTILEKRKITDLNSIGYILEHKKTKAKVVLMDNDDDNKVFYIGFRTPPKNSTGVAHILEHSVLCGSKKFPVKDPFVELAKGSLNTFLNAMTYPDKTVYPVASCNDKDFANLMDVYLDAVFYPNIYNEKNIFLQEGWHYHLENIEDEITYNGVVYNEMKGAFSSPDDILDRAVFSSLYPEITYGFESGGDPDNIPELSYEEFLDFHRQYYHPSNSYIYLYGNMDFSEKLEYMDREYLSHFEYLEIDSTIEEQEPFEKPIEIYKEYSVTEDEENEDGTYLSYNFSISKSVNREHYVAFQVLDYALCSAPGAPLKQALIDKNIGNDVYSVFENGINQTYFSIVAKDANESREKEFVETVFSVLKDQAENGINKKALQAAINYYEFKYKEADFGSYPKGLMYGLQALDSWLYDETKPFIHIEANDTYKFMKEQVDTGYFEHLIKNFFLENNHAAKIVVKPVKGLTTIKEQVLAKELKAYKDSLTKEELEALVAATSQLEEYQECESSKEDLEKIPLLKREDLKREVEPFIYEVQELNGIKMIKHDIFTNGVSYIKWIFDITAIDFKRLPYLGLLKTVLGYMDTTNYTYGELFHEMHIQTGAIGLGAKAFVNSKDFDDLTLTFDISTKVLYENTTQAYELMEEILFETNLKDEKRLLEIVKETKSRIQASLMSAGHSVAALHALSSISKNAAIQEEVDGIGFYRFLCQLEKEFEQRKQEVIENLEELRTMILCKKGFLFDYTGTEEGLELAKKGLNSMYNKLSEQCDKMEKMVIDYNSQNVAYKSSAGVQYVCRAGEYLSSGLQYTGALRVLKVMMGYEYLWQNVRVKNGAYGCMSSFQRTGDCYFVSYRDPNLAKTIEIYENASEYIKNFQGDERSVTKFIIGALSELDTPKNPSAKGFYGLSAYMTKSSIEEEQKYRDELLDTTAETIRSLSAYVEAFMACGRLCVVGNEGKIMEEKALFDVVENLI